jgi:hypothetical protein
MDPKAIRFERIEGRKPVMEPADRASLAEEGRLIRDADQRDGTNAFLEAAFDDATADEPEYKW